MEPEEQPKQSIKEQERAPSPEAGREVEVASIQEKERALPRKHKEKKRKKALKEAIEAEIGPEEAEEVEKHKKELEKEEQDFERYFQNLAYQDLGKALKAIKHLPSHKKDQAVDVLKSDDVFWHLVRTGQVIYEV